MSCRVLPGVERAVVNAAAIGERRALLILLTLFGCLALLFIVLTSVPVPDRTGARAFALDTRSKRRWETPPLEPARAEAFRAACAAFGFSPSQVCYPCQQRAVRSSVLYKKCFTPAAHSRGP